MRLFVGIAPDDAARAQWSALIARLRQALGSAERAFRWTPVGNVHITLNFIGSVAEPAVDELRHAFRPPIEMAPFAVTAGNLGAFPNARAPRVIWCGLDLGAASVVRIHDEVRRRLDVVAAASRDVGRNDANRPFVPHLTLARVRDRDRHVIGALRLPEVTPESPIAWRVDGVVLYRSDLSGAAPRYDALEVAPLSGPSEGQSR